MKSRTRLGRVRLFAAWLVKPRGVPVAACGAHVLAVLPTMLVALAHAGRAAGGAAGGSERAARPRSTGPAGSAAAGAKPARGSGIVAGTRRAATRTERAAGRALPG